MGGFFVGGGRYKGFCPFFLSPTSSNKLLRHFFRHFNLSNVNVWQRTNKITETVFFMLRKPSISSAIGMKINLSLKRPVPNQLTGDRASAQGWYLPLLRHSWSRRDSRPNDILTQQADQSKTIPMDYFILEV